MVTLDFLAVLDKAKNNDLLYAAELQRCGASKSIAEGRRVHALLLERGQLGNFLANHLINMYGKCGCLEEARRVFDWINNKNLFSWTAVISAYAKNGHFETALELFQGLDCEGIKPDSVVFLAVVEACSNDRKKKNSLILQEAGRVHERLTREGLMTSFVRNSVITMYGCLHRPDQALLVFQEMAGFRDVVSWTAVITAYGRNGHFCEALRLFWAMEQDGIKPDAVTILALLDACALEGSSESLFTGRAIHARICATGLDLDVVVMNAVIYMYTGCKECSEAKQVFDGLKGKKTLVSWNAVISAYAQSGHMFLALQVYKEMLCDKLVPNEITLVLALDACSNLSCLENGRAIHDKATELGVEKNIFVENALVDMYGKCGSLEDALTVFNSMKKRDIVSWTAMIAAYARNGHSSRALEIFRMVLAEGLRPDGITFVAALEACGNLGNASEGETLHGWILDSPQLRNNELVSTAVISMYDRSGRLERAKLVFDDLSSSLSRCPSRWNSQAIALAEHGLSSSAIQLFWEMTLQGVDVNAISFVTAIFACSHSGMLVLGLDFFLQLHPDFGIVPQPSHYICMVELLARIGQVTMAVNLIESMPYEPDVVAWMALLCSSNTNLELATMAARQVLGGDGKRAGAYVLLSNLCVPAGRREWMAPRTLKSEHCSDSQSRQNCRFWVSSIPFGARTGLLNKLAYARRRKWHRKRLTSCVADCPLILLASDLLLLLGIQQDFN
ncbi:pentatricopeptide repeat-containing protein At4g18520, chloroplastic-like [Selaginella moellendorffii]|uniref:pentatricopeptide repeat-containing protein At4g18520, chloroplastic-like n=1 Tax=Selaginella moellendorffii TaxID=88036 RepID=UPI000D1C68CC|nr:pentatricopeptide repeat-containing protein At4g18520, chloroplastic-like [Selaginella moellendorffii]|eukprot:XP_024524311.1 pentatricopeptide repeat-containing protein At4g18520, chloroplastic-like [Selaginella moellendorffii]